MSQDRATGIAIVVGGAAAVAASAAALLGYGVAAMVVGGISIYAGMVLAVQARQKKAG
jgi:hypothetical protein